MELQTLGKDVRISETTIPAISPYWRLKHSGKWKVLWKYDPDEVVYLLIFPIASSILPLCNGKLTAGQIALILQYAHGISSFDACINLVIQIIGSINDKNDCIVKMTDKIAPFVKAYDPLDFIVSPQDFKTQGRLEVPLNLNIMFSNNCQTKCIYCYADRRYVPPSSELSTQRWKEILQEAKQLGIEAVSLSGGDPLFRKDSVTLIAELIKLDMLFLLSTKCHVSQELADQLVSAGMTSSINQIERQIQISLDGPDPSTADVLVGRSGYFERAVDSINNLVARNFNLRVKAVVTPVNAPRIFEWAQMLDGLGVKRIACAAYNRTYFRHDDSLFLNSEDRLLVKAQFDKIKSDLPNVELARTGFSEEETSVPAEPTEDLAANSSSKSINEFNNQQSAKATAWKNRAFCSGGRSSMTITPDGRVVLCDTVPQDEKFVVGDLSVQSIMEVWHSDKLINFVYPDQETFKGTKCYNCEDRLECHILYGYCFRDSFFNYNSLFVPPPKCPAAVDDGLRME